MTARRGQGLLYTCTTHTLWASGRGGQGLTWRDPMAQLTEGDVINGRWRRGKLRCLHLPGLCCLCLALRGRFASTMRAARVFMALFLPDYHRCGCGNGATDLYAFFDNRASVRGRRLFLRRPSGIRGTRHWFRWRGYSCGALIMTTFNGFLFVLRRRCFDHYRSIHLLRHMWRASCLAWRGRRYLGAARFLRFRRICAAV